MSYLRGIRMDRGTALAANDANGSFATTAEKASMFNDAIKVAYAASVFNEAGFTAANKALVFNEAGFTTANKALVFNEAGFTTANKALVFNEAGFTTANKALVFNEAGFTTANKALVFNEAGFTTANKALVFNEAGFTAANKALVFNEAGFTTANKALVFNEAGFTAANKAGVCNHTNLTASILNAICDNANISTATIKAILDVETVIVASQLGAMLEGTQLTAANAATVCNDKYTDAQKAAAFNNAIMSAARSALIFNEAGFTTANKALVFNEAGFTAANKALVFHEAGLSIANINSIIIHANITDSIAQEILNATSYATRDLTSATSILYATHDDWADNKLTSRDNRATTAASILGANEFAQKFRPEWTVSANVSASGGAMVFSSAATIKTAEIASTFVTGTWEIDAARSASIANNLYYRFIHDGSNSYAINRDNNSTTLNLYEVGVGNVIASTWSNDAANHTFKVTRDGSGNFAMFEDGAAKGTGSDTTITTSVKQILQTINANGGNVDTIDNLKVY